MIQLAECSPNKCKALSSDPGTTKKEESSIINTATLGTKLLSHDLQMTHSNYIQTIVKFSRFFFITLKDLRSQNLCVFILFSLLIIEFQ